MRLSTPLSERLLAFWSRKATIGRAPTGLHPRPGVSIGSLYQYFPSKEALVAAVIERHTQELSRVVRDCIPQDRRAPDRACGARVGQCSPSRAAPRQSGRCIVSWMRRSPVPDSSKMSDAVVQNACALSRAYLEAHRNEIDIADLDRAAFILITTVKR